MPKSLYEGNIKVTALADEPSDPENITLSELEDGVDLSCAILRTGYRFSATGSDTLPDEATLCDTGNIIAYGASNFEFNVSAFRYRESSGQADPAQDVAWDVFAGKGTIVRVVERVGKPSREDWDEDDEYRTGLILLDDRQQPTDLSGYEKFVQPGAVQSGGIVEGAVVSGG